MTLSCPRRLFLLALLVFLFGSAPIIIFESPRPASRRSIFCQEARQPRFFGSLGSNAKATGLSQISSAPRAKAGTIGPAHGFQRAVQCSVFFQRGFQVQKVIGINEQVVCSKSLPFHSSGSLMRRYVLLLQGDRNFSPRIGSDTLRIPGSLPHTVCRGPKHPCPCASSAPARILRP